MATRAEKRLRFLSDQRDRIAKRIVKNVREHKSTGRLRGKLIDLTTEQLKLERRLTA